MRLLSNNSKFLLRAKSLEIMQIQQQRFQIPKGFASSHDFTLELSILEYKSRLLYE